jgi:hypothetical protein
VAMRTISVFMGRFIGLNIFFEISSGKTGDWPASHISHRLVWSPA